MPVPYNSMHTIDINCDLGEGFPNDKALMKFISSANIACGYHAGDIDTIKSTIAYCVENGVAIGAHPGFNDKANFGRTEMQLSDCELYDLVAEQITLMQDACKEMGASLHHVKPHGALYNMAAKNTTMSYIIAGVIKELGPQLVLYGLSNSYLITEARALNIKTASEVFADRTYNAKGQLTPRSEPNAMIHTTENALAQVLKMIEHKTVIATDGSVVPLEAETICIHGDGDHAVSFATSIYTAMHANNILIKPCSSF
ncbi:MAG: 5-oxoprolinase subunit PxpA [Sediminibacterium sp.]|uniref:5-oxoprolinase subunit PxpA n=1 Tax=Sediminibacterium sp. TaxID=1917865 RepID=UPI00271AC3AA|nr:5-oxoprolinase subunit PxpA [Sediminibacterium sp.]MDO8995819.1 5-oxoprolinase subunit PxpA [Sediminibacterium sp.]